MTIMVTMRLQGATRYDEETKSFVGFCPALKVYSQGKTEDEAKRALESTLALYVETCYTRNILQSVLSRAGFKSFPPGSARSVTSAVNEYILIQKANFDSVFEMDVPLELVAAAALEGTNASSSSRCA